MRVKSGGSNATNHKESENNAKLTKITNEQIRSITGIALTRETAERITDPGSPAQTEKHRP